MQRVVGGERVAAIIAAVFATSLQNTIAQQVVKLVGDVFSATPPK